MQNKYFLILTLAVGLTANVFAQYEDTGVRGKYFSKKKYTRTEIPDFEQDRLKLPSPVLTDNKDYEELYWKAWELAYEHYKHAPEGSPFVSDFIDEAFVPNIFQWDTIFMIMFARYAHYNFPAIQSLDNFYALQYENGYICREIEEKTGKDFVFEGREHTVNPPLFSWAEVENYRITGDKSRFASVLPVLEKYTEWLEKYRKKENTVHGLYWNTGLGSGMDNVPRSGSGWVDMSVQMVMCYRDMANMAKEIGASDKAKVFQSKAEDIAARVKKYMWNAQDGIYYDVDDNGNQIKVKTIAGFWPLLVELPTTQEAELMMNTLKNPSLFWRQIPFASLSADNPQYQSDGKYWLGSVWAPTNVMVIKGIDNYGKSGENPQFFYEFGKLATETYLDAIYKVYKKTGTIWENYSPDSYSRGLWSRPDFVGWSGCGPIELLIENVLGFRPEGAQNKLTWYLGRKDLHGIKKLRFGNTVASLICKERKNINSSAEIEVESNNAFTLIVKHPLKEFKFSITAGKNNLKLDIR